jgi:hypothetical protein
MRHHTLKLNIALVLIWVALSGVTYASEVGGSLSSSGDHTTTNAPVALQNDNPSSSQTDIPSGTVAGSSDANFSYPTTAKLTASSSRELALEDAPTYSAPLVKSTYKPSLSPAAVGFTDGAGLGAGSWFWIILLSFVMVGGMVYFYSRPADNWERA